MQGKGLSLCLSVLGTLEHYSSNWEQFPRSGTLAVWNVGIVVQSLQGHEAFDPESCSYWVALPSTVSLSPEAYEVAMLTLLSASLSHVELG